MNKIAIAVLLLVSGGVSAKSYVITIPTDSKAQYTILEKGSQGGMKTIVTKRVGPSGTSYSKRIYDCKNSTVKYLGDGETLEQMKASSPDPRMSGIVYESIAYYLGVEACKE
ncbi:hypothetical protein C5E18_12040 [Pectobacterium parmentieri]|uniref:hypothetical protein n=1 Tax=Pectobacterium parmentieri TaxID=1905730 RepID=UPI000F8F4F64|nr:hypothetical protein [Pectobacterium parmentieri]AZS56804.1 hypothetical protein C5E18_12040 [Pectobacterium parmentieri]